MGVSEFKTGTASVTHEEICFSQRTPFFFVHVFHYTTTRPLNINGKKGFPDERLNNTPSLW